MSSGAAAIILYLVEIRETAMLGLVHTLTGSAHRLVRILPILAARVRIMPIGDCGI